MKLLVIDDEVATVRSMSTYLKTRGFLDIHTLTDSRECLNTIEKNNPDIVLLDLNMPHINGITCLENIKREFPKTIVIILTADNQIDMAVKCTQLGAHDYFIKPIDQERLVHVINQAYTNKEINNELVQIQESLLNSESTQNPAFHKIITQSKKMIRIFEYISAISISRRPVLILGETGTGKELIARAIHKVQTGKDELVSVNVAGLDDSTFSDTLFGHNKGAFTSAVSSRSGLIKKAGKGSLFLDEIGDLDEQSQIKLLRLFQENSYYPLGSDKLELNQARFITATHQDLNTLITEGKFRKDLYFRLAIHIIKVPPLSNRREDIPLLTEHFVEQACTEFSKKPLKIPAKLYSIFEHYSFPGNIRELEVMLYNSVIQTQGKVLNIENINSLVTSSTKTNESSTEYTDWETNMLSNELPTIKNITKSLIEEALRRSGNNVSKASEILGITRQALSKRLKNSETK